MKVLEKAKLEVTPEMMNVIYQGLFELPYRLVRPIVDDFDRQIKAQMEDDTEVSLSDS